MSEPTNAHGTSDDSRVWFISFVGCERDPARRSSKASSCSAASASRRRALWRASRIWPRYAAERKAHLRELDILRLIADGRGNS